MRTRRVKSIEGNAGERRVAGIIGCAVDAQADAAGGLSRITRFQDFRPVKQYQNSRAVRDDLDFGGLPQGG